MAFEQSFMNVSPTYMTANPIRNWPMFFNVSFLELCIRYPIPIIGTAKRAMFTENPRDVIHAVRVVPMLAPMITPMALPRVRSPALTKLTTMMVVADDDCTRQVTTVPVSTRLNAFEVILAMKALRRSPADFWRPSLMRAIP